MYVLVRLLRFLVVSPRMRRLRANRPTPPSCASSDAMPTSSVLPLVASWTLLPGVESSLVTVNSRMLIVCSTLQLDAYMCHAMSDSSRTPSVACTLIFRCIQQHLQTRPTLNPHPHTLRLVRWVPSFQLPRQHQTRTRAQSVTTPQRTQSIHASNSIATLNF